MKNIFIPQDTFTSEEWIMRYKVMTLLIMCFIIGLYLLSFGLYRISEQAYLLGTLELIFSAFLLFAFISLRANKNKYMFFARIFFIVLFIILILQFLTVEDNTRFHWVPTTLIFIFFVLDTKGGLLFLFFNLLFIFYLMFTDFSYTTVEYITWSTSLSGIAIVMYFYEKIKEKERDSFLEYTDKLKNEVAKKTKTLALKNVELQILNTKLEDRVEEELSKRLEQEKMLLRQCRMANIGELIDAIAHQWRQPLMNINAVLMNIDILSDNEKREGVLLNKSVDEIASLTKYMSKTIEDFRTLYKDEKQKTNFLFRILVEEVLALMKNNLQGIDVQIKDPNNIYLLEHKGEVSQFIVILLSNAIETLHLRDIYRKKIIIRLHEDVEKMYMEVEDNAGGIKREDMDRIFDPYFTTKEQTGGTGLGLYIAKIIIEHIMHGKINLENTILGAKFTVTIPNVALNYDRSK